MMRAKQRTGAMRRERYFRRRDAISVRRDTLFFAIAISFLSLRH
jgi:hypothetical protein